MYGMYINSNTMNDHIHMPNCLKTIYYNYKMTHHSLSLCVCRELAISLTISFLLKVVSIIYGYIFLLNPD